MRKWPLFIVLLIIVILVVLILNIFKNETNGPSLDEAPDPANAGINYLLDYETVADTQVKTLPPAARQYCRTQGGKIITKQELDGNVEECVLP